MIEITRKFSGARVVVIGDLIADEYVYAAWLACRERLRS